MNSHGLSPSDASVPSPSSSFVGKLKVEDEVFEDGSSPNRKALVCFKDSFCSAVIALVGGGLANGFEERFEGSLLTAVFPPRVGGMYAGANGFKDGVAEKGPREACFIIPPVALAAVAVAVAATAAVAAAAAAAGELNAAEVEDTRARTLPLPLSSTDVALLFFARGAEDEEDEEVGKDEEEEDDEEDAETPVADEDATVDVSPAGLFFVFS